MNRGFTLIELLVVVLIIGILSAVALPQYQTAIERSRATEALTMMSAISDAVQRYYAMNEAAAESGIASNAFNKLDVDIPKNAACASSGYGGKHFCLTMNAGGPLTKIYAQRMQGDKKLYALRYQLQNNDDGTFTVKRSCHHSGSYADDADEAKNYCNAITGGNINDF